MLGGWLERLGAMGFGVLLALPAGAAEGADGEDAATRTFREGRELLRAGRVAEGCEKLRASLELKRSPGILLNVASCARDQGDLLAAVAGFETARTEAQSHPDAGRRQLWTSAADDALRELRPRLAEIRLVLPSGAPLPSHWAVRMDGEPLALRQGRALQNPGTHHLEVEAERHALYARGVRLAEGEHLTLEIDPRPAIPAQPAPAAVPSASPIDERPTVERETPLWPVALAVGGGALTVAGLTFGLVTWQRTNDLESECPGPECPNDDVRATERLATVADVLVVSGVVLGVAGGAGLLWGQRSEPNARLQAACSGTATCRASLTLKF